MPSTIANKQYELSDHLGNVTAVIEDYKTPVNPENLSLGYTATVTTSSNYYPFGMLQLGRNHNANEYRFGFNGQEKVDEISGLGNHNTAEFWEYDTRTGRRWNLDPKPQISISDYACFGNNPILNTDVNGDTTYLYNLKGKFMGVVLDKLTSNEIVFLTEIRANVILTSTVKNYGNDIAAKVARDPSYATARYTKNTASQLKNYHNKNSAMSDWVEPGGVLWIDSETKELQAWNYSEGSTYNTYTPFNMFESGWDSKFIGSNECKGEIFMLWHGHIGGGFVSSRPSENEDIMGNENISMNPLFSKYFSNGNGIALIVNKDVSTIYPWGMKNPNVGNKPFNAIFSKFLSGTAGLGEPSYGSFTHKKLSLKTKWNQ